jgi:aryl-alcohol dehydrogenase-like predicted oxidoreductase
MEARRLGRTEHHSSLAILGAAAFWESDTRHAEAAFDAALAAGVNHVDIAPRYGEAQRAIGPLIAQHRSQLFVACKTMRRDPSGVRAQLDESLSLLGCDSFDLYQVHALTTLAELDERAAAFDAIRAARDAGRCRFIGVTGHGFETCDAQAQAVQRYDLDTVMFPVNPRMWADDAYRRSAERLLDLAAERDLGVMAIKAVAARPWGDTEHPPSPWYEPYSTASEIGRGVRFALSVDGVHAICTPGDVGLLAPVVAAANVFEPMSADDAAAAIDACRDEAPIFDGAAMA